MLAIQAQLNACRTVRRGLVELLWKAANTGDFDADHYARLSRAFDANAQRIRDLKESYYAHAHVGAVGI